MIPDYATLRFIWWALLGILLIGFAVTDGYDLGTGMLLRYAARSDGERRQMLESIEPHWEGHQVWLILGGGASFAAWPLLYATAFSGFYLAMFIVLAALILRPVGFAFRNKRPEAGWRNAWDWALFVGGLVPALIFGVAFGNLLHGVPFHLTEDLRPVYDGGFFGLLNPFAVLCGLVSIAMLAMHGGSWIALKTDGVVAARSRHAAMIAAAVLIFLFALAGLWVAYLLPGYAITGEIAHGGPSNPLVKSAAAGSGAWLRNYDIHRALLIAPAFGFVGALATLLLQAMRQPLAAFLAGAASVAGVVATAGVSMFPFLLPSSSDPRASLTVWDASSSRLTLWIMLIVTAIFLPVILCYTGWAIRVMRGKVALADVEAGEDSY
jgi:cytochrome bd ubiquinol oxidase subunit II